MSIFSFFFFPSSVSPSVFIFFFLSLLPLSLRLYLSFPSPPLWLTLLSVNIFSFVERRIKGGRGTSWSQRSGQRVIKVLNLFSLCAASSRPSAIRPFPSPSVPPMSPIRPYPFPSHPFILYPSRS